MPSTFVNDLRLEEIATGEKTGTWGTTTNTNLELIAEAFSYGSEAIANASTHTITVADGTSDEARSLYLKCTGGGQACTVTLAPNTLSKVWLVENATSATLTFSQGSGANVAVLAGEVKAIATDGGGSGAIVYDLFTDVNLAGTTKVVNLVASGNVTIGSADISEAELEILDGANITTTELNILDGDTSATSTTVADADRVVLNDNGTMKQVAVTDLSAYFDDEITAMPNLVTTAATTVGALDSGSITSGFGTIDTGSSTITTTGLITGGSLDIDDVIINGSNIGHTNDTDLITVANGLVTVAGEISVTTLDIGGTNVTSTAAELNILDGVTSTATELNIMDGDTSATSTTLADADRVVVNDAGTMKQVALTDFETYFESALDTLSNVTTVGALNSGSITSGFGAIDNGSSAITTTGTITGGVVTADDVSIDGKVITMTGSSGDTAVLTAGTNGTLDITTTDAGGASANIQITADGTAELAGTTVTLDSSDGITLDADGGTITFADGGSSLGTITSSGYSGNSATATLSTTVTVTDSTANTNFPVVFHNESNGLLDDTGALRYNPSTGELLVPKLTVAGTTTTVDTVTMNAQNAIIFEGATADANETTLTITDPTADRTIKLPNQSGTLPVLAADSDTAITSTPAELNLLDGVTSTTAELNILDGVTSTTAEINIVDGNTSATSTTLADADRVVVNDNGTMVQVALTDFETYFESALDTLSNVTTVGALNSGSITSGFGTIDTGSSTITTTGLITGGSLDIDDVVINGSTIGHTDDTDLITVANGVATVAGELSVTTLDIGGTNVTTTAAELNILDGNTSASSTTLADADRLVTNDAGTMKQVALTDVKTYLTSAGFASNDDATALAIALG